MHEVSGPPRDRPTAGGGGRRGPTPLPTPLRTASLGDGSAGRLVATGLREGESNPIGPNAMKPARRVLVPLALVAFALTAAAEEKAYPTLGTIERVDPRFDAIVPKDARVERLADGYDWS